MTTLQQVLFLIGLFIMGTACLVSAHFLYGWLMLKSKHRLNGIQPSKKMDLTKPPKGCSGIKEGSQKNNQKPYTNMPRPKNGPPPRKPNINIEPPKFEVHTEEYNPDDKNM
jgi:hypothetical protein